jgi:hypothetical protein
LSDRRDEKALASVVSEARAERVPELDWAKLEAKLDALPPPPARPKPSPLRFLVPPLAVAAAIAVAYFSWPEPPAPLVAERTPVLEIAKPTDGDSLAPGSRVEARNTKKVVTHPQRATWTLEPGSLAEVVRMGEIITIRLLTGSIVAEVVPSDRPETFVIEARDVRVAVRGTRFRVALPIEGVDVDVTEGRVMVGPRQKPGTGRLLVGPTSEHFSPATAPVKPATAPMSPSPGPRPSAFVEPTEPTEPTEPLTSAAPVPVAPAVPEPSPGAVDTAALHAIELTSACFRQRALAPREPSPPVHTTLTVKTHPDGNISSIQFSPPLARQVEVCVKDGLKTLHGPVSPNGIEVSRAITLER